MKYIALPLLILSIGMIVIGSIRMVDDIKSTHWVYKLKDCADGNISFKHVDESEEFTYEIGDKFTEYTIYGTSVEKQWMGQHTYIVLAKFKSKK